MLKTIPGALGVCLSPLLFGTVSQDGKALVGLFFATSLFLLGRDLGSHRAPFFSSRWGLLFLGLLVFQYIPLPPSLIEFIAPERIQFNKQAPFHGMSDGTWSCLALSRSRFINRSFELLLGIAAFLIVRESAKCRLFPSVFLSLIATSVALLGAADVWYRIDGGNTVLGLWNTRFTRGAGTFENRNLFANWIYVATLLCFGVVIRFCRPLRSSRVQTAFPVHSRPLAGTAVFCLLGFGVVMAILSGSRGGLLVFGCGIAVLATTLAIKTRDQKRWAGLFVVLCALLATFLLGGEFVFSRLAQLQKDVSDRSQYGKLKIWDDGSRIHRKFPWTGTGLGTFVTGHRVYKSMDADMVATHAENDYLQTLVETGVLGFAMVGLFLGGGMLRMSRRVFLGRHAEPEILYSGCAAIVAFLIHGVFEFVAQNPATLILACSVLGLIAGILDVETRPALPRRLSLARAALNYVLAGCLGWIAVLNGVSFWHHHHGVTLWQSGEGHRATVEMARAVRFWPWSTDKQLALVRARLMSLRSLTRLEQRRELMPFMKDFASYMAYDPFHWELRVEYAWMNLIFNGPTQQAIESARAACFINPRQPKIPLAFARHLMTIAPDEVLQFLQLVPFGPATPQGLAMAVELELDPAVLWTLVPATAQGFGMLGEFAFSRGFPGIASQAFEKLGARVPRPELCRRYIAARQPAFVVGLLGSASRTREEEVLLAKAHLELGNTAASLQVSRPLWTPGENLLGPSVTSRGWLEALARDKTLSQPQRARSERFVSAIQFVERLDVGTASEGQIGELRRMAREFPSTESLLRPLFDVELRLGNMPAAARISLTLAELKLSASMAMPQPVIR